ncbi:hypothetical protein SORBI_3002G100600 [Sorghum bicolor]|uniref:Ubiquitin-like domain-containing protein n=2 Tax=Sorghum bicolor TaxID=4558 RepID=A0A1B6QAA8_SORBI|nr:hypothetical protein SORBI_3002G100600 [Sorghum bicolor]OQU88816.1 hypothetical protein SORBI_3002G100600 [Sorghum bicolor]OQU88817.1 hypothetical protein SORBI_3002G100600 [Sorghum bicolor]OQU88818.1 hypothetical protein SORBI_3002G100600 [Sorghum bicolor]OQU88819.1 hypothetical protein SORBI_3002G100600 [Sorghum bicolor]
MYIRVKRNKTPYFIQCEPTETALSIKQKLHSLIDQPPINQQLLLWPSSDVLEDSKTLADQKAVKMVKSCMAERTEMKIEEGIERSNDMWRGAEHLGKFICWDLE